MANKKQGNLTAPPQWWKHLRDWKTTFWKSERQAQKRDITAREDECEDICIEPTPGASTRDKRRGT